MSFKRRSLQISYKKFSYAFAKGKYKIKYVIKIEKKKIFQENIIIFPGK